MYAEPNGNVAPNAIPSDSYFSQQWGLKNSLHPGKDIHAEGAWNIFTGNPNNIIAIIDGGTNKNHLDLDDKISGGDNGFGWGGHGVHVSGIAAAESNNNQGVAGVDWNARIHAQRIDNVSGDAETYQAIVDAVNYSSNVSVLNNSWGLRDEHNIPGRYSTTVKLAYVYAYNANRCLVSAMGNHNQMYPGVLDYPAGFGIGLGIGATDNNDNIANFSVHGNCIDVCAPGFGIYSTIDYGYDYLDGTSMATPFVSGIASLLKGYNSNLYNDDIENIIRLSADKVVGMNGNNYTTTYGYGRVNAEQALKYLQSPYSLYQWTTNGGSVASSTGLYKQVFIGTTGLSSGVYFVKRYEVRKNVNFPQSFYSLIGVWGRGVATTGWDKSSPNLGMKFCEVVPGTATTTGVTLRTYVYEVFNISGASLGYYPTSPSNVHFAYTALGVKAIITGTHTTCSSNSTFSLQNCPQNSSILWSHSSNLTQVGGNNGTTYTVKAINSSVSGNGWVKAIVDGIELIKTFWVGKPDYTLTRNQYAPDREKGSEITIQPKQANFIKQGVDVINWQTIAGTGTLTVDITDMGASGDGNSGWWIRGKSQVYNNCGMKEKEFILFDHSLNCNTHPNNIYLIHLNNNQFQVVNPCKPSVKQIITSAEIYDLYGVKINNINHQGDKVNLDNNNGQLIILKANTDNNQTSKIIQH